MTFTSSTYLLYTFNLNPFSSILILKLPVPLNHKQLSYNTIKFQTYGTSLRLQLYLVVKRVHVVLHDEGKNYFDSLSKHLSDGILAPQKMVVN